MNLNFNLEIAKSYKSQTQIIRILSENWTLLNSYCPNCGERRLINYANNNPAGDFFCEYCNANYELKSSKNKFPTKIVDGAYDTMLAKLTERDNPHFFFLNYSSHYTVTNFFTIPSYFFIPNILEKRKPLSQKARRAGWIGCNILINKLPDSSKVYIVKEGSIIDPEIVRRSWEKVKFIEKKKIENRGWVIEVMSIIDSLSVKEFNLEMMYGFEHLLKLKFPNNNNIRAKVRQQLQILRDQGFIKFLGHGQYTKV